MNRRSYKNVRPDIDRIFSVYYVKRWPLPFKISWKKKLTRQLYTGAKWFTDSSNSQWSKWLVKVALHYFLQIYYVVNFFSRK